MCPSVCFVRACMGAWAHGRMGARARARTRHGPCACPSCASWWGYDCGRPPQTPSPARPNQELSFTWLGFIAAVISNVASALRGILAKKTMSGGIGKNMDEANTYAVLTILAFFACLPIGLFVEPPAAIAAAWSSAVASGLSAKYLTSVSLLAGAFYYLYNEVALSSRRG